MFRSWPGGQFFVPQVNAGTDAFLERVIWQEVFRDGHLVAWIAVKVFLRRLPRVVRCVESQVHEKRSRGCGGLLQKRLGIISQHFAPMPTAFPESAKLGI